MKDGKKRRQPRRSGGRRDRGGGGSGPTPAAVEAVVRERRTRGVTLGQLVNHFAAGTGRDRGELRHALRPILRALESSGKIVTGRGKRYFAPEFSDLVTGRLSIVRNGLAVVRPTGGGEQIMVGKAGLRGAIDGDLVLVRRERPRQRARSAGVAEGVVVKILERPRRQVVGRWVAGRERPHVRPLSRKLAFPILPSGGVPSPPPRDGELVVVELERGPERGHHAQGRLVEVLGMLGEPFVEDRAVLRLHGIPEDFPPGALEEAAGLPETPSAEEMVDRWDLRDRPAITIDGETARDFDDAVSARRGEGGDVIVEVHIADVSHYVRPGTELDGAARERGTSVYLPGRCVPMLPETLSNGLCSLVEGVDRLTFSVVFTVAPDGTVRGGEARPSVIRSRRRCTYREVAGWLEEPPERWPRETAPFAPSLQLLAEAASRLGARRRERGSLDFDLAEPEMILDPEGRVISIQPGARNRAHRLIEELMVAANECVARILMEADQPAIFRVHDTPAPEKVDELRTLVRELGLRFPAGEGPLKPSALQSLLDQAAGTGHERLVSMLVLRTLARALYSPEPRGHFALATGTYLHFTSPIRRYPDLVVHRMLRRLLAEGGPVEGEERLELEADLERVATNCSLTERRAEDAERDALHWKKVLFLKDREGEVFSGHIGGVTAFGLFVQLDGIFVDGLVHISELADDYYVHDEARHTLTGERSGRVWRLGDAITVRLLRVNLDAMQLELTPVDVVPDRRRPKRRPRR